VVGKVLKTEAGYYDDTTRFNLMSIDSAFSSCYRIRWPKIKTNDQSVMCALLEQATLVSH
jgi:hypothetical protein